jgi:hypothetical protein
MVEVTHILRLRWKWKEKERERERKIYIYIHDYICIHSYMQYLQSWLLPCANSLRCATGKRWLFPSTGSNWDDFHLQETLQRQPRKALLDFHEANRGWNGGVQFFITSFGMVRLCFSQVKRERMQLGCFRNNINHESWIAMNPHFWHGTKKGIFGRSNLDHKTWGYSLVNGWSLSLYTYIYTPSGNVHVLRDSIILGLNGVQPDFIAIQQWD